MIRIAFGTLALAALALITACGGSSSSTAATGAAAAASTEASPAGASASATVAGTVPGASTATGTPAPGSTTKAPGTSAAPKKLGTSAGVATTSKAPDFAALAGAKAAFGKLGDSVYQIEMPNNWNGELVLFAHGFAGFGTEVSV